MNAKTLVKINDVPIQVVDDNGRKLVPVKPICEAIGVDFKSQYQKLENDEFLSSVVVLSTTTGSDGKQYEMVCLPYEYVFGWLFTINPKNVKEEARETVAKYRIECYDALYRHFTAHSDFLHEKQKRLMSHITDMEIIRHQFVTARERLNESKKKLDKIKDYTFEEWQIEQMQQKIPFPENQ